MTKIAIIIGSTRPQRKGETVAKWVFEIAKKRSDAEFELIDLKEVNLPFLDEPLPAGSGKYSQPHTKAWAARIAPFDGFVFVTPEYNHSTSPALKTALDFLFAEWRNKACGFVGYGGVSGARAIEHLRQVVSNFEMADVRSAVGIAEFTEFKDGVFTPLPHQEKAVNGMLDQVIAWSNALAPLRAK
jgi:NAD(P)H-dependent FMN reductase